MFASLFAFSSLSLFLATTVIKAGDDGWHLDYIYQLVQEELDPVVSPNAQGSHMHKVVGGSRFGAAYNYANYAAAKCSSLAIQADKSNYWYPCEWLCICSKRLLTDQTSLVLDGQRKRQHVVHFHPGFHPFLLLPLT
jgi:hypothetical protein